jgi:hypothetical protein
VRTSNPVIKTFTLFEKQAMKRMSGVEDKHHKIQALELQGGEG